MGSLHKFEYASEEQLRTNNLYEKFEVNEYRV